MTAPGYRLDEAALEVAYKAYLDCPIDMCGDHDEECEKTVRAAIVAYLEAAAPQPEPPLIVGESLLRKPEQLPASECARRLDNLAKALDADRKADAKPEPPANGTFWGWLCNGKGDGWEEKDKVVHDPDLIKMRRERPDLWRIEGLYRAPAPGDDAKPEPPADLVERAEFRLAVSKRKSISQLMAAFAQEHAEAGMSEAERTEWLEASALARDAIHASGRGMIGRERNYLQDRVARAILAERRRQSDRIEKLEAALKWVGEVYPDTLPSRGARVEMTWDEFNAMREVMGLPIRKPKPRARAALNRE